MSNDLIKLTAKKMMQKFDVDKNGSLDHKEILAMLNGTLKMMNKAQYARFSDAEDLVQQIDLNHDNRLNLA